MHSKPDDNRQNGHCECRCHAQAGYFNRFCIATPKPAFAVLFHSHPSRWLFLWVNPMPVPASIDELSANPADNYPGGSEQVFPNLDDYLRFHAACIAQLRDELQVIGIPWLGSRGGVAHAPQSLCHACPWTVNCSTAQITQSFGPLFPPAVIQ